MFAYHRLVPHGERGPRLPTPGAAALRLALAQLTLTALALVGAEVAAFYAGPPAIRWLEICYSAVGLVYVGTGVLAWARRPSNRTGALLCLCGLALIAGAAGNTGIPWMVGPALIVASTPTAILLHLLLAFPSGHLANRVSRVVVVGAYGVSLVMQAPLYLFSSDSAIPAALRIASRPDLVYDAHLAQRSAGALIVIATAAVLVLRLWRAAPAHRRVFAPLYAYGLATILFLEIATGVVRPLFHLSQVVVLEMQLVAAVGLPLAFVAVLLRGGFAWMANVEELGAWLGATDADRSGLREALGKSLGDPSLKLLFRVRDRLGFANEFGQPVEPPSTGSGREMVTIELDGQPVAAIDYDAALIADPELVRAAGRVAALALERERLTAELRAQADALRESRARIVAAGDQERRRIARDLHDGLQAHLVVLALRAGEIASNPDPPYADKVAVRTGLEDVLTQLRGLVHGLVPPVLVDRGLFAAAEELADRMPIRTCFELHGVRNRFPAATESAGYFLIAEALANAIKHAKARELVVRLGHADGHLEIEVADDGTGGADLETGMGLRGIADRLDALGGRLQIDSPPGKGTRLVAEIPCVC